MEIIKQHIQEKINEQKKEISEAPKSSPDIFPPSEKRMRDTFISDKIKDLLILQMGHELFNYNLYKTFAAYFHKADLPKLGEYFEGRANEEFKHHNWVYNYLVDVGAEFSYPIIEPVKIEITDHILPFKLTVDQEIDTTIKIKNILNVAIEEKDWFTVNMLNGTMGEKYGILLPEQINSFV